MNAYVLGAVPSEMNGRYKCHAHSKVDCAKCFDWVGIIKGEARTIEEEGRWLVAKRRWMNMMEDGVAIMV